MNKVILMGRLTRDPEVRYTQGEQAMAVARYTLAVDRRGKNQEKTRKTQQTSSSALHSARRESSLRDTCIKGQRLC